MDSGFAPAGGQALFAVLLAPFVGSFLGTLALRLPAGRPVVLGRSRCTACGTPLGPLDLVPLASWLTSGGRCRHCGAPLGWFYPAIEVAAVMVAAWAGSLFGGWLMWAACLYGWLLLALAAGDLVHLVLPDALTGPLAALGLVVAWQVTPWAVTDRLIGMAAGFVAFWLVAVAYRRLRGRDGLGLGDAKLLAAVGAWVGWAGLPSVVLLGALFGLAAVLAMRLAGRPPAADQPLPFGACLAAGAWPVWLYGPLAFAG